MQLYEVKKYFGRNYFSTCQHCGTRIYKRNKGGIGKHAWLPYSKAAYKQDADGDNDEFPRVLGIVLLLYSVSCKSNKDDEHLERDKTVDETIQYLRLQAVHQ